ncbi:GAF domain protein [anaerobic digester metagenome]
MEGECMGNKSTSEYGMGSGEKVESVKIESLKKRIETMPPDSSLKEVSEVIMEAVKTITSSENCYVAYLDPENHDSVGISFSHMTGECQMYAERGEARFKVRKDGTYGGLLGYSLDTGESFYVRNPAMHPAAHGIPKGHVPVSQFLSVPAKYEGEIVGQIVLGNPSKDYTSRDVDMADAVADIYAEAVKKLFY